MKKRKDGRYAIPVSVGYNDNGSLKRIFVYGRTQRETQEKAEELRRQHRMGMVFDRNITLGEWAETWLSTYKTGLSYNTVRMYEGIVRKYVSLLGHLQLDKVKTAHLQKVVNDNASKGTLMKQFKLTVGQIFEQAVINDLLIKNPVRGVKLPVGTRKAVKRALTVEETEKIRGLELDGRTRCFVFLLLYTGMRKGEALALTKSDIDRAGMAIMVNKSLVFMKNQSFVKDNPKTAAGVRSIPILEPLRAVLFGYLDGLEGELLFTTKYGTTFSHVAYGRMYNKFCAAMGSKDITAHIFRHNFATMLYNAGVDIKSAQSILGHKSIHVTMDVYTHLDAQKRDVAVGLLNDYVRG
jgi:integrase